jgi:hypothetical protein
LLWSDAPNTLCRTNFFEFPTGLSYTGATVHIIDNLCHETTLAALYDDSALNSLDQPMTPCPSAVEYVTPVFAKNYQVTGGHFKKLPDIINVVFHNVTKRTFS